MEFSDKFATFNRDVNLWGEGGEYLLACHPRIPMDPYGVPKILIRIFKKEKKEMLGIEAPKIKAFGSFDVGVHVSDKETNDVMTRGIGFKEKLSQ